MALPQPLYTYEDRPKRAMQRVRSFATVYRRVFNIPDGYLSDLPGRGENFPVNPNDDNDPSVDAVLGPHIEDVQYGKQGDGGDWAVTIVGVKYEAES